MSLPWTDARIEAMAQMRANSQSYGEIAVVLGVSRNAALGKAGRLRQAGVARFGEATVKAVSAPKLRPQRIVYRPKEAVTSWTIRERPVAIEELPLFAYVPAGRTRSIVELSLRECRYELRDGTYCACHTLPGRSYCRDHARIIYVSTRKAA